MNIDLNTAKKVFSQEHEKRYILSKMSDIRQNIMFLNQLLHEQEYLYNLCLEEYLHVSSSNILLQAETLGSDMPNIHPVGPSVAFGDSKKKEIVDILNMFDDKKDSNGTPSDTTNMSADEMFSVLPPAVAASTEPKKFSARKKSATPSPSQPPQPKTDKKDVFDIPVTRDSVPFTLDGAKEVYSLADCKNICSILLRQVKDGNKILRSFTSKYSSNIVAELSDKDRNDLCAKVVSVLKENNIKCEYT